MVDIPTNIVEKTQGFTGRVWLLPKLREWSVDPKDHLLLVTGDPGCGKSTFMAWLAGAGQSPRDTEARSQLEHIRRRIKAIHFCRSGSGNTAPGSFAQSVAAQLTRAVPGYSEALAATLPERLQISVLQQIGTVNTAAQVTGVSIGHLDFGSIDDEVSFDRFIRAPLKRLYRAGDFAESLILLVDALDEAARFWREAYL